MPIWAKNAEILLLLFTLNNFGQNSSVTEQQTSKWQKNLPWLQQETLLVKKKTICSDRWM